MFTLHVTGLVICAFTPSRLELLFLDASGSDAASLPHHLPSVVARRTYVRSYSLSRLASIHGRFAGKFANNAHFGWSMEGMTADGGEGAMPVQQVDGETAEHPDPANPDFSSLHWVLDLNRMLPGLALKDDYRRLGRFTNAIVRLRGGRVRGGQPSPISAITSGASPMATSRRSPIRSTSSSMSRPPWSSATPTTPSSARSRGRGRARRG